MSDLTPDGHLAHAPSMAGAKLKAKLSRVGTIPPGLLVIWSLINVVSNIEWIAQKYAQLKDSQMWPYITHPLDFLASGLGNLLVFGVGILWLGYLIVKPVKVPKNISPKKKQSFEITTYFYRDYSYEEKPPGTLLNLGNLLNQKKKRTYLLVIENSSPDDLKGVRISVSKILRHARDPGDKSAANLENIGKDFYPLPFLTTGSKIDFPVGHKEEIEFISFDDKQPEFLIIGGRPGTLFQYKNRVLTITVQAVALGQKQPSTHDFDVWIDREPLFIPGPLGTTPRAELCVQKAGLNDWLF